MELLMTCVAKNETFDVANLLCDSVQTTEIVNHLKSLAHPVRLKIACVLIENEYSVGQLEQQVNVHQPTLSQQLTVLREGGLVDTRREGKQIFYRIKESKSVDLIVALSKIFT